MIDSMKERMMQEAMGQITPSETPVAQAFAHAIASIEARQMAAITRLAEAADVDEAAVGHLDAGAREEQLLGLADALADDRMEDWWLDEVAAGHLDDPDRAADYLGMDREAWVDQIATWGENYRQAAPDHVEGMTDAQIADLHVRETFGIPLREFTREVVDWTRGEAVEGVLAGNLSSTTSSIHRVAAELED
ncbi:hypothetical protein [Haloplanus ruber]